MQVTTAFDRWVTEASKLSEMYANMAREACRPVGSAQLSSEIFLIESSVSRLSKSENSAS
jgi:hypothetical protein